MKRYYKLLTVFMTVVVFLYLMFGSTQVVFAAHFHEPGDNVVYKEAVTLDTDNSHTQWGWDPTAGMFVYKVDDKTGIPTGSVTNGMCFFKYGDNDKFGAIPSSQFVTLIINNGLGLVMSDAKLQAFYTAYLANISSGGNNKAGSLIDSNGNVLGLCLNDISGCVYDAYPQNTDISIPSTEVNNVYNYYQYYITTVDPQVPDYINVQTYDLNEVKTKLNVSNAYTQSSNAIIDTLGNGIVTWWVFSASTSDLQYYGSPYQYGCRYYDWNGTYTGHYNSYDTFCRNRGLTQNGQEVGYTSLISSASGDLYVRCYNYDNSAYQKGYTQYQARRNTAEYNTSTDSSTDYIFLCRQNCIPCSKDHKVLCVYRNDTVLTQVVNKTYAPSTYTSTTYNNYDTNSDNSITTNSSVVNNSQTTNNEIYNDASESFSEYYSNQENYNIDNSVVIQNTTEIIYNYYGNGDDPDPNPNPNPDDDDDTIWKALLKAIVDFFKKIGELIAALLTGLLELFNIVLGALADINTSFTGIKDFLSSIFSWFPTEIVTLMVLGLGLALLASFITWFKR